jgi:nucleotide-binding universal stress UspA family protein
VPVAPRPDGRFSRGRPLFGNEGGGDDPARPAIVKGALELARKKGLEVVVHETYPPGTTDFSAMLNKVKAAKPDVLVAGAPRPTPSRSSGKCGNRT